MSISNFCEPVGLRRMAADRVNVRITRKLRCERGFDFKINGKVVLASVTLQDATVALWGKLVSAGVTDFEIVPGKGGVL